jgi:hypothetical protein
VYPTQGRNKSNQLEQHSVYNNIARIHCAMVRSCTSESSHTNCIWHVKRSISGLIARLFVHYYVKRMSLIAMSVIRDSMTIIFIHRHLQSSTGNATTEWLTVSGLQYTRSTSILNEPCHVCLSVCSVVFNAFIQFSSDLYGRSHVPNVCFYI